MTWPITPTPHLLSLTQPTLRPALEVLGGNLRQLPFLTPCCLCQVGFMFGQYKRLRNEWVGILTGKG